MDVHAVRRENFRRLMVERYGGKQRAIAEPSGMTPTYVSFILTGRKNMGEKKARDVEKALKLPKRWLDELHDPTTPSILEKSPWQESPTRLWPVLEWNEVVPYLLGQIKAEGHQMLACPYDMSEESFILPVKDDSMRPRFSPNDHQHIWIDPRLAPTNGDFVVVAHKPTTEPVFRRHAKSGDGRVILQALAQDWEPRAEPMPASAVFCGLVVFHGQLLGTKAHTPGTPFPKAEDWLLPQLKKLRSAKPTERVKSTLR